jgi:hypothetical protein
VTAPSLTFVQAVRDFLDLDTDATSRYTDQTIGSNIRQASWFLERQTGRLFGNYTGITRTYTTNGEASLIIPGFRTLTSVTWAGTALTSGETYWAIPDSQQTGVYTGLQLRGYRQRTDGPAYLHSPAWFDRGLDSVYRPGGALTSNPNDLVILGDAGYIDGGSPDLPEPARFATKVMAAFLTKYPDAVLVGTIATANDGSIDLSGFPLPVQQFIADWSIKSGATVA